MKLVSQHGAEGRNGGERSFGELQQNMVKFDVTREEAAVIRQIAARAHRMAADAGWNYATIDASMDVTAAHSNGCPLRLERLLEADDFNFAHDVFGIRRHIDRETGELGNCFSPRCSR